MIIKVDAAKSPLPSVSKKFPMKISKLLFITLLTGCSINEPYDIYWSDIDWGTCGPGSISRRIGYATDKKDFWISQKIGLESILEAHQIEIGDIGTYCTSMHTTNQKATICLIEFERKLSNIASCINHATKMCRVYGGFC